MLRRRALTAGTAALAVGALALAGLTGVASADPAGTTTTVRAEAPGTLPPGLIKALQRDLGLDMRRGSRPDRQRVPGGHHRRRAGEVPRRQLRRSPGER